MSSLKKFHPYPIINWWYFTNLSFSLLPFSFFISSILIKIFLHLSRVDLTQLRLLCNLQISRANRWRSCKSRSMRGSWMMSRPTWPPLPGMKFAKLAIELYRLFVGYPLCTHRKYLLDIYVTIYLIIFIHLLYFLWLLENSILILERLCLVDPSTAYHIIW